MKRNLRSKRMVDLALDKADEERQKGVGEFVEESHSFLNEEYPETEPFSNSGSSDEYQPSSEENEVSSSYSDGSICDHSDDNMTLSTTKYGINQIKPSYVLPTTTPRRPCQLQPGHVSSTITQYGPCQPLGVYTHSTFIEDELRQRLTALMPQNNKQHDLHQAQTYLTPQTNTEHEPDAPKTYIMPQTNTESESHPPQTYIMSQTNTESESHLPQPYIMPQTNTESESHPPQTYIMHQTNAESESHPPQTYIMPQTNTESESHLPQPYIMPQTNTESESHPPQTYIMHQTNAESESHPPQTYIMPQTNTESESHPPQTYIMSQTNTESESHLPQPYIMPQTNTESESHPPQTYIMHQTNAESESHPPQTYIMPQTNTESESHPPQTYIMSQTNTESESHLPQPYIMPQTNTESESHPPQTYIMPQTNTESESHPPQTYIMSQTNTESESHLPQPYIMPQTNTESESHPPQTYIMHQTNAESESHPPQTYIMPQTNTESESHPPQTYIMPQINTESESHPPQTYIMPQTNTESESYQPQTYIMPQTNNEPEPHQLQIDILPQTTTELESFHPQVDDMLSTTEGHQAQGIDCKISVGKGRNKDFCFYCETQVLNFARHIMRNHYLEFDVQKILACPKKSQSRRNLITDLKKKGNYIANMVRCESPMRMEKDINHNDYLPCPNCLGFYARKQLWKHKKKCNPGHSGKHTQAEAQNLLCRKSSHAPSKSLEKVFSRMRADKISFVAKQDPIICEFGENYLKIHREEHFVTVTSRKMRELAKLLIETQKEKTQIKTFFDALKPQNYDLLVAATKTVAKYDETSERYRSPTYAMNISTSIKQCCNIAIKRMLKTEPSLKSAEMQADLRTLIQLIESNWKFDVSSNAADDLNLKKWNKVTIVPLASDLKLLKDHLCSAAQNAVAKLTQYENSQNTVAYNELVESVFCRALLLNRRRPGELQRLLLSTYIENENKDNQYEEFDRTLNAAEKILVQRFKRIVIRGKRSRGVPVLFSTDVQQDLNLLISLRSKYVDVNNKFLFAKPSGMTSLCGYKVLQKHVKLSGAKNPEAISSTKLRKHLATLTQLFNMNENDIEQLSNFMGHTTGVHRRNYRLPDDIFQTAKISKLLILMEDGKADAFKGKSLDEININVEENLEGEELDKEDILNFAESENILQEQETLMATDMSDNTPQDLVTPHNENAISVYEPLADMSNITSRSTKKKRVLVPWTTEQKKIVINHFKRHIKAKKAPKRHECDTLKALHPELLDNKDWLKIKVFIQNYYTKN